jgi:antibiotic biosynthesis monooxygenase (ABM) superfamily enzyme
MALARTFPGFLGGGWVMSATDSQRYFVQYRFTDEAALSGWLTSPLRKAWARHGSDVAEDAATHRRTGIEGWFDSPDRVDAVAVPEAAPASPPPRWKQALTIWLGFFPLSLLMNWLLVPHLSALDVAGRTLVVTVLCTPLMVYFVLPFLTAKLGRWLRR